MIDGMLNAQMPAPLRAEIKTSMLSTPQYVAVSAMEGMVDDAIWTEDQIKVPALAVLAKSPFWPPDNEQRYRKVAPDMDYQMWEGVTHFLMMDKPDEFNRTLASFLARHHLLKQK
jgi:pimeloyl-ACP methyl ester carboxylesterase